MKRKKEKEKPVCPHGHTDEIIPCFYGLPEKEAHKKMEEEGTAYWMGCIRTLRIVGKKIMPNGKEALITESDDPKWYCKIHKITF